MSQLVELPAAMGSTVTWTNPVVEAALAVGLGVAAGLLLARFIAALLRRAGSAAALAEAPALETPCALTVPLLALVLVEPDATWAHRAAPLVAHAQYIAWLLAVGWLVARLLRVAEVLLRARLVSSRRAGPDLRKVHTQIALLRKTLATLVAGVVLALVLMSFSGIRHLGTSLLASAGVAGIVVGIAAQRSLGNVIAGFQILFTETLRIDDAIVVEGEWGSVEDLTLTHVVVKLWDLRRLVLPLTYFIEKPFQNWTHASSNLLGTVTFWVDFAVDVEALRRDFLDVVAKNAHWDHATAALQVTDLNDRGVELRALVSAADAGSLWDLRCEVREAMIGRVRALGDSAWPRRRLQDR